MIKQYLIKNGFQAYTYQKEIYWSKSKLDKPFKKIELDQ